MAFGCRLNLVLDTVSAVAEDLLPGVSPFIVCGVVAVHLGVAVELTLGLIKNAVSVQVLLVAAVAMVASFFGWGLARKAVTGFEELVLLEHAWAALAAAAVVAYAFHVPIPSVLNVTAAGLCTFLAVGRVGCFLVGCCYGIPAAVGVAYRSSAIDRGFPGHLVGVRLLPVPLIESVGLVALALLAADASITSRSGNVFLLVVTGYSALRLGTEGLRSDQRPHILGLSVARWICLFDMLVAAALGQYWNSSLRGTLWTLTSVATVVFAGIALRSSRHAPSPPTHYEAAQVRALVATLRPGVLATTTGGCRVLVLPGRPNERTAHIVVSAKPGCLSLPGLCTLVAAAIPEAPVGTAEVDADGAVHVLTHRLNRRSGPDRLGGDRAEALYGSVLRKAQTGLRQSTASVPAYAIPAGSGR